MNREEKIEKIRHMKAYFFISFGVSFVLLLVSTMLCMVMSDYQHAFVSKFFTMDSEDYNQIAVMLLGLWKVLIVQFTLIPGLALWIVEKHCSCKCK